MLSLEASVDAEVQQNGLLIKFYWNGDKFEFLLRQIKSGYYSGNALWNGESGGTIFLWMFRSHDSLLLKGTFKEEDAGDYECFIELKEAN